MQLYPTCGASSGGVLMRWFKIIGGGEGILNLVKDPSDQTVERSPGIEAYYTG